MGHILFDSMRTCLCVTGLWDRVLHTDVHFIVVWLKVTHEKMHMTALLV